MLVCFFGKRGSGKTTVIRGNLENMKAPVVVLDILGNFDDPSFVQTTTIAECVENVRYYIAAPKEEKRKLQKIIVLKCSNPDAAIDFLSATLWESHGGTLVIDEADGFNETNAPCFDQIVRYGRNRGVDIVTGCRRPAEISRNITAGANRVFIFQTQEPRDVDYFESTVLGEKAEILMKIPKFHGLFVDYDESKVGTFRIDEKGVIYKLNEEEF